MGQGPIAPPALLALVWCVLKMGVVSNFPCGPHHYKSASYVHVTESDCMCVCGGGGGGGVPKHVCGIVVHHDFIWLLISCLEGGHPNAN
jgi:hypothetical protein